MKKCKYADKYKAVYPPKCGPCAVCKAKWDDKQIIERLKVAKERKYITIEV